MIEEESISRRRLRTWIRLLRVTKAAENTVREFLRTTHGTTLPRFDVMAALYRRGDAMKMSDLSRELLVSNGNATAVVERLEKEGLAKRVPGKDDRRVVTVQLTHKGRDAFEEQAKGHKAEVNKYFAALGPEDLDILSDLMKRIEGTEGTQKSQP